MNELAIATFHILLTGLALVASATVCTGGLVMGTRLLRRRRFLGATAGMLAVVGTTVSGVLAVPLFAMLMTYARGWTLQKVLSDVSREWLYFDEGFIVTIAVALLMATPVLLSLDAAGRVVEEPR